MLHFFQSFCSGSWGSCARKADPSAPVHQGVKASNAGSFLEALSLKPSVVDDGELQFPPRSQVRPRVSNPAATRQKSLKSATSAAKMHTSHNSHNSYAAADFQDLPHSSLQWQTSQEDWGAEVQVNASSHRGP